MVTLRPSLSRATAEEGAANQRLQAFSGTHSHPPTCGQGSGGVGRRCSVGRGDPALTNRPHAAAGPRRDTSGVAARVPKRQCGVSSLPEGASPARTEPCCGVQNLAGGSLRSRSALSGWRRGQESRSLKMAHTGNLEAGVASAGSPGGAVQPFPVEYPGVAPEASKFGAG